MWNDFFALCHLVRLFLFFFKRHFPDFYNYLLFCFSYLFFQLQNSTRYFTKILTSRINCICVCFVSQEKGHHLKFPFWTRFVKPVMQLKIIITALQRSCGKTMFSVVSVCYSACPQRGSPCNYTWTCTNLRFVKASGWPSTERPSCYHTRSVTRGTKLLEINLFIQLDTSFDSPQDRFSESICQ